MRNVVIHTNSLPLSMNFERRFELLQKKIQNNSTEVIDQLIQKNGNKDLCIFCGSKQDLTKEHVLPQWTFNSHPQKHFVTNINGLSQRFIKTVVPACKECNSFILGLLEKQIQKSFEDINFDTSFFSEKEQDKIITWLEIIDYKFQALNLRRTFIKPKSGNYVPYLADIPLAVMQNEPTLSVSGVRKKLMTSFDRLISNSKNQKRNSLVVFKTNNPEFHFFHEMDDFIFLELPKYDVALFMFFDEEFEEHKKAHKKAISIINDNYYSDS